MEMLDVLHFYLGCQMLTDQGIGRLVSVNTPDQGSSYSVELDLGAADEIEWGKPILRPMSSITPEDLKLADKVLGKHVLSLTRAGGEDWDLRAESFETVKFLLDQGFDLYKGIEAGWAIDYYTAYAKEETNV